MCLYVDLVLIKIHVGQITGFEKPPEDPINPEVKEEFTYSLGVQFDAFGIGFETNDAICNEGSILLDFSSFLSFPIDTHVNEKLNGTYLNFLFLSWLILFIQK